MSAARVAGREVESQFELEMTPMIDVIFQLLIFFMCTISFKILEGKLDTFLPKNKGPGDDTPPIMKELRLRISYEVGDPMVRILHGPKLVATLRRYAPGSAEEARDVYW